MSVGPYTYVTRDQTKEFPEVGLTFRVILYGAYNAFGLIGTECNGIAVLDNTNMQVVLDEHCKGPAGFGKPTVRQAKEYEHIMTMGWDSFRAFINNARRVRWTYTEEGRPLDPAAEQAKDELSRVRREKGVPLWVSQYLNYQFSSGGHMGPDGEAWIKECRKWLRSFLKEVGGTDLKFNKMHFEWSAFFKIGDQWFYMSCSDCRFKISNWLLVRTAKGPKDYTGGCNQQVRMDEHFQADLLRILKVEV